MINLLPPLIAEVGVSRNTPAPVADILTVTLPGFRDYPLHSCYQQFCDRLSWIPYGGGSILVPGDRWQVGSITSGFRDEIMNGNRFSAHRYALAFDISVGDATAQLIAARVAAELFPRVGCYPYNGFLHVDLMPDIWTVRYDKKKYWVKGREGYILGTNDFQEVVDVMTEISHNG